MFVTQSEVSVKTAAVEWRQLWVNPMYDNCLPVSSPAVCKKALLLPAVYTLGWHMLHSPTPSRFFVSFVFGVQSNFLRNTSPQIERLFSQSKRLFLKYQLLPKAIINTHILFRVWLTVFGPMVFWSCLSFPKLCLYISELCLWQSWCRGWNGFRKYSIIFKMCTVISKTGVPDQKNAFCACFLCFESGAVHFLLYKHSEL